MLTDFCSGRARSWWFGHLGRCCGLRPFSARFPRGNPCYEDLGRPLGSTGSFQGTAGTQGVDEPTWQVRRESQGLNWWLCILEWQVGGFGAPVMRCTLSHSLGSWALVQPRWPGHLHLFCKMAECRELNPQLPATGWKLSGWKARMPGQGFFLHHCHQHGEYRWNRMSKWFGVTWNIFVETMATVFLKVIAALLSGSSFCTCLNCYLWLIPFLH